MSELSEISQRIADLLAVLNIDVPSEDADLFQSGLMDSVILVEFLSRLEEQMGITMTIDEQEPYDFSTIRRISALVLAHQKSFDMARG